MNEYKKYIKDLADKNQNTVFYNSGPNHAAWVMSCIFGKAEKTVKIFAGNLSGTICNNEDYRSSLGRFIMKGGKLKVLIQKDKSDDLKNEPEIFKFFRFYSVVFPDSISVKKHPYRFIKPNGSEVHFTVADDKMYRLEDDVEKFTAVGNFNDVNEAISLSQKFDEIFEEKEIETVI